jgi:hypothetical protein
MCDDDDPAVLIELRRRNSVRDKQLEKEKDDDKKANDKWKSLHMQMAEARSTLNLHEH